MGSWPEGVPFPSWPDTPEGITQQEFAWYCASDTSRKPELRDKIEAAMGWKKDDIADAREIAEKVLGAVKNAEKGHVPEENLFRYRNLMRISRNLKSLGDTIGPNDMTDSTILWRMAKKYRDKAQELRADIPREEG
jgi:hypothetical protein